MACFILVERSAFRDMHYRLRFAGENAVNLERFLQRRYYQIEVAHRRWVARKNIGLF
jgi:hypothetical protein